ncbi:MAG: hypothetical protein F4065_10070 [Rhodothermaceae bacterium]|nr:hypothetical protein [Rhodothermaceae bacterium]MXZ57137.1 hypothetical protein [Rhodothermaceae bacterium]MYB90835.1 hypothetical protein [Rhodothermaceae bacterium]MYD68821.1 hypothetical protein [Rhodothermaceae bacterium]MYG45004.1 hypothetical protein [Rhodothermaceae bacterium]
METFVRETGDMVRVLEIKAEASDLETDVRLAVKKQQSVTVRRGFRPGHVPRKMIRRIHASEIEDIVVQDLVKEVFEDIVIRSDKHDVVGRPREISREYKLEEDLHVQIEFYVLPKIELKDFTEQVLEVPVAEVTGDLVQYLIKIRMAPHLPIRSLNTDEKIGEADLGMFDRITFEYENVDRKTGHVLIGAGDTKTKQYFDYATAVRMGPEHLEFGETFKGYSAGDEFVIEDDESNSGLVRTDSKESNLRVKILEAERYDWPEIDDEWAAKISDDSVNSPKELNGWAQEYLEDSCEKASRRMLEGLVQKRICELHPFSIPVEFLEEINSLEPGALQETPTGKQLADMMREQVRWNLLLPAIEERLNSTLPEESSVSESANENAEQEGSSEKKILAELAEQFKIKQIPATEWQMMRIVAEENPVNKPTPTDGAD